MGTVIVLGPVLFVRKLSEVPFPKAQSFAWYMLYSYCVFILPWEAEGVAFFSVSHVLEICYHLPFPRKGV